MTSVEGVLYDLTPFFFFFPFATLLCGIMRCFGFGLESLVGIASLA